MPEIELCEERNCKQCWDREMPKTYEEGLQDAWELARKIFTTECFALQKLFGHSDEGQIIMTNDPQEALAKLKAYEETQEIKVGDVVYADDEPDTYGVVTWVKDNFIYVMWNDGSCGSERKNEFCKTSKHIDIESLLGQIRGTNE
jgi:hypothetical protein